METTNHKPQYKQQRLLYNIHHIASHVIHLFNFQCNVMFTHGSLEIAEPLVYIFFQSFGYLAASA